MIMEINLAIVIKSNNEITSKIFNALLRDIKFAFYNYYKVLFVLFLIFIPFKLMAEDGSNFSKIIYKNGDWQIVEITAPLKIIYRIATDSINIKNTHLTIDLLNQCKYESVVMIKKFKEYSPIMTKGKLILQYKISNQLEFQEIVETDMSKGDTYGFFIFKNLLAENLYVAKESSRLTIWVPPSGDGQVKRSQNFYFSLNGFKNVYSKAKSLCSDNN